MEKVVVYQTWIDAMAEVIEYFRHLGYEPHLVKSHEELLSASGKGRYRKVFVEVNNLSDILFLHSLSSVYQYSEIVLIVPPHLEEIIGILSADKYSTIKDITHIGSNKNSKGANHE